MTTFKLKSMPSTPMTEEEMSKQCKAVSEAAQASDLITEANESETLFPRWKETTEARYDEMLGVLPPEIMWGDGFLVGEPADHRRCRIKGYTLPTFDAFRQANGTFYYLEDSVTVPEFKFLIKLPV